ncbi:LOW QUALITY PROTEIN: uncharacterized protein O3C94_000759 [Discoglossus pictus]
MCRDARSSRPAGHTQDGSRTRARRIRQQDRDKIVKQLIKFKPLFPQYDAKIDVLSNMSNFESSVQQYMLSPKEACVIKLCLPGSLASRLEATVSGPNDSNRDWFKEHKWGTEGDRLRAVSRLVTGNRDLDSHFLAEMRVTVQDDPWVFASKFEQVYRLTHRVPPDQTPSDMLQYLVRKFTYLDPSIQMMAEEKDTMEAVLCIIGKARQNILRKGVTGPRKIAVVTTNEGKPNPLEISFRGICFAEKAKPLYDLLKGEETGLITWGSEHENSFRVLKEDLASAPALATVDSEAPFALITCTTDTSMSSVLLQEKAGEWRPVG